MNCAICLEENNNLIKCISIIHDHGFCNTCFDDWIHTCNQNHSDVNCPICHILIQKYEAEEEDTIYEELNTGVHEVDYYYTYENNILTEYYDAEKTQKAFTVTKINDKFEGIAITYWCNGNIMRISNYINDNKYGTEKEYNSNGTLYGIQYIYNGHYHGSRKIFNEDGSTNIIEHYAQGNLINNDYLSEIS
jgi:hypothetical protein